MNFKFWKKIKPVSTNELEINFSINKHIISYLKYYFNNINPSYYAILLNGKWGTGKTFLIKNIINNLNDKKTPIYVSLYGVQNTQEIDAAIFRSIWPLLNEKKYRSTSVAKKFYIVTKFPKVLDSSDWRLFTKNRSFIFDDIERAILEPEKILAFVNQIVEHENGKVLLVGDEEKFKDKEIYLLTKEKVIGKTFEIKVDIESILENFINKFKNQEYINFINENIDFLLLVLELTSTNNLRILNYTLIDFYEIYKKIYPIYKNNVPAMEALFFIFIIFSIEIQAGVITKYDIQNRPDFTTHQLSKINKKEIKIFDNFYTKFNEIDINIFDQILSNDILLKIFFDGNIDDKLLNNWIGKSEYFQKAKENEYWRLLWNADKISEKVFFETLTKVQNQIDSYQITNIGELTHILGINLWLSDIKVIKLKKSQLLDKYKYYLDHLFDKNLITDIYKNGVLKFDKIQGYGGLGIINFEDQELQDFIKYFSNKLNELEIQSYPKIGTELLSNLRYNVRLFCEKIYNNDEFSNSRFHTQPIFNYIDTFDFVNTIISHENKDIDLILISIKKRYSDSTIYELEKEKIHEIIEKLLNVNIAISPIKNYFLQNSLKHFLSEFFPVK